MSSVNDARGPKAAPSTKLTARTKYAKHVIRGLLYVFGGYVITLIACGIALPFYVPFMAWLGMIYVAASALCVAVLGVAASRRAMSVSRPKAVSWFVGESALGVGLASLYSATVVPLYSGTDVSALVGIQFVHSVLCFVAAVLFAGVWAFAASLREGRQR